VPENWYLRRREILLKGPEAVHLLDEINSWDPTPEDDPRRPYRLEKLNAYQEAMKLYQASLPWEARHILKQLEKTNNLDHRGKLLSMFYDVMERLR